MKFVSSILVSHLIVAEDLKVYVIDGNNNDGNAKKDVKGSTVADSTIKSPYLPGAVVDSIATKSPDVVPQLYKRRWLIVILFALYSMTNSYQWIHLSIIGDKILFYYNASLPESQYSQQV